MIDEKVRLESPEIEAGLLVVFRSPDDQRYEAGHPLDREWQERAHRNYPNPLYVRVRVGNHVVLVDPADSNQKDILFGSTCDPSLHVGHVKLFL